MTARGADPRLIRTRDRISIPSGLDDSDYVLLDSGDILALQGSLQTESFLVGELAFSPTVAGDRLLLGRRYSKSYVRDGRGLAESARPRIRDDGQSPAHLTSIFRNKSIVRADRVIDVIRAESAWSDELAPAADRYLKMVIDEVSARFGSHAHHLRLGLTGAARIDTQSTDPPHDADLVFRGTSAEVHRMGDAIREFARENPRRQVHEHGKRWSIRVHLDNGLLCPFFSAPHVLIPDLASLQREDVIAVNVCLLGLIVAADDGFLSPTVLEASVLEADKMIASGEKVLVVASHLRSRGDFSVGSVGRFRGDLVELHFPSMTVRALVVTDGTSSDLVADND